MPKKCDIAIIGAGIVGIGLSHFLQLEGCDNVMVLEKEHVGYGASGRNAGFLLAGLAEPYSRLVTGMGRHQARLMMAATLENHDLISESIALRNIECGHERSGAYHLAITDFEAGELEESVKLLDKDGFKTDFFDLNALENKIGFGKYRGGQYSPCDGCLDPFAFVNGLADINKVFPGFEVKSIEKSGSNVRIIGDKYQIDAEMAILATNAYSGLVDRFFEKLVFPVRGQMLSTNDARSNPLGKSTYYANFGYDYFRGGPGNSIIMGGLRNRYIEAETGIEDSLNPALQSDLETYIYDNIGVSEFKTEYRWSGIMGNTVDGLPIVGPLPHNNSVLAAVGYNGHGFGLGMVVARDLARALAKNETSDLLKRFSIKRFSS